MARKAKKSAASKQAKNIDDTPVVTKPAPILNEEPEQPKAAVEEPVADEAPAEEAPAQFVGPVGIDGVNPVSPDNPHPKAVSR